MKKAGYTVTLNKVGATWYYFTDNPQGGGFGSNNCGPKYAAVNRATRSIPAGTLYRLIVNGRDCGRFAKAGL